MFSCLRKEFSLFKKSQYGITSIEYGLIAVAIATFVVLVIYGNPNGFIWAVANRLEQLASLVTSAVLSL